MSKFIVEWLEEAPTKTGKKKATVSFASGEKVTIWGDYPGFDQLKPGSEVEGDIVPSKDPKYGPTLYPPRKVASTGQFGANRGGIAAAQATKRADVSQAMDRKEESIKVAGAIRDSVLITTAKMAHLPMDDNDIKVELQKWQKYVYELHNQPFV